MKPGGSARQHSLYPDNSTVLHGFLSNSICSLRQVQVRFSDTHLTEFSDFQLPVGLRRHMIEFFKFFVKKSQIVIAYLFRNFIDRHFGVC